MLACLSLGIKCDVYHGRLNQVSVLVNRQVILHLIFALFSGLLETAFSILIRMELYGPGVQYIADNQLYNSIITAHAIIMIFFMIMPAMIGGLGNFLLPLLVGGPDMAFPRLKKLLKISHTHIIVQNIKVYSLNFRELSLTVKHVTFNHYHISSNLIALINNLL